MKTDGPCDNEGKLKFGKCCNLVREEVNVPLIIHFENVKKINNKK